MLADMDIIDGNPLQDIETIANDVYVMQNGRLFTEQDLLGPYANVHLNTPPTSASAASMKAAEARTLPSGKCDTGNPVRSRQARNRGDEDLHVTRRRGAAAASGAIALAAVLVLSACGAIAASIGASASHRTGHRRRFSMGPC